MALRKIENNNKIIEIKHIEEILSHTALDNTPIFFVDLDNTLFESTQELGSNQWFEALCKYGKEHAKAIFGENDYLMPCLEVYNLVQHQTMMKAVEENTAQFIKDYQEKGIMVIGLTARGKHLASRTVEQLQQAGIDIEKTAPFVMKLAEVKKITVADQEDGYSRGIIFCSGKDKGECSYLFYKENIAIFPPIDDLHFMMIDDAKRHVEAVEKMTIKIGAQYTGFRYGFLDEKVKTFSMEKANSQLLEMRQNFPEVSANANKLLDHLLKPCKKPAISIASNAATFFATDNKVIQNNRETSLSFSNR